MVEQMLVRVIRDYTPQYTRPISVRANKIVHLGNRDDEYPEWQWCRSDSGLEGWVPVRLLMPTGPDCGSITEDYDATELEVRVGETLNVTRRIGQWARVTNASGANGWVPEAVIAAAASP